ncbi:DUF3987 domain-containing protein [Actinomadura macrotermitis]|uniref:DUF3987 domain-containing protein n=1 Tax=Actinomadura macrotermitis TaxID=2585200 RepID=UPI0018869ECC
MLSGRAGEEIRIERIGRASERIDAATLTIGVYLQPGVLTELGDTPEFREQGLLGRLLVSMPESLLGRCNTRPDPVPAHLADDYARTASDQPHPHCRGPRRRHRPARHDRTPVGPGHR